MLIQFICKLIFTGNGNIDKNKIYVCVKSGEIMGQNLICFKFQIYTHTHQYYGEGFFLSDFLFFSLSLLLTFLYWKMMTFFFIRRILRIYC